MLWMSLHTKDSSCCKKKYQLILNVLTNPKYLLVATVVQHADVNSTNKYKKGIDTTNPPRFYISSLGHLEQFT